jgi:hypothetical protein
MKKMNKLATAAAVALGLVLSLASGCNESGAGNAGSAGGAAASNLAVPLPPGSPPPAGTPATPAVGESCQSGDTNHLCLALHFVAYKDPTGTPTANAGQAATIIHTMNQLWTQCDIGFEIEKYEAVDPTADSLAYGADAQNQLNQIRTAYEAPANELLAVTTGPWGTTVNAWTNMPGDGIYGAIMEDSIVGYGGGIIYAHEFGHYLGLDHVSDTSNLMNPIIYTTSTAINSGQCQTAKDTVHSFWAAMLR